MLECQNGRIDGQQPPCLSTDQRCDGVIDCIGGEDELDYNCPCEPEGAVRLVGGFFSFFGRVEFCVQGRWSTLCAESRRHYHRLGRVVCRQLGYPSEGEF